jgi:hypothetical protein
MISREVYYNMQRGMIDYFMNLLDLPRGEVWAAIKDACFKCVDKLDNNNKSKSWCYAIVPKSEIKLRIDVHRQVQRHWQLKEGQDPKMFYRCEVKFSSISDYEQITDVQVEDYIVEKILLEIED